MVQALRVRENCKRAGFIANLKKWHCELNITNEIEKKVVQILCEHENR